MKNDYLDVSKIFKQRSIQNEVALNFPSVDYGNLADSETGLG